MYLNKYLISSKELKDIVLFLLVHCDQQKRKCTKAEASNFTYNRTVFGFEVYVHSTVDRFSPTSNSDSRIPTFSFLLINISVNWLPRSSGRSMGISSSGKKNKERKIMTCLCLYGVYIKDKFLLKEILYVTLDIS